MRLGTTRKNGALSPAPCTDPRSHRPLNLANSLAPNIPSLDSSRVFLAHSLAPKFSSLARSLQSFPRSLARSKVSLARSFRTPLPRSLVPLNLARSRALIVPLARSALLVDRWLLPTKFVLASLDPRTSSKSTAYMRAHASFVQ